MPRAVGPDPPAVRLIHSLRAVPRLPRGSRARRRPPEKGKLREVRMPLLAVFAVFAENYQPRESRSPQKSWTGDASPSTRTAEILAVLPLFFAVFCEARAARTRRANNDCMFAIMSQHPFFVNYYNCVYQSASAIATRSPRRQGRAWP